MRILGLAVAMGIAVFGQVSSNQSLNGKYYFRQTLLVTDGTAKVASTSSGTGTITFNGSGTFTLSGQQLSGTTPAGVLSGNGTYTVKPGGYVTLSNPLRSGATINARLGVGALMGSSTEAGPTVFDLFIAIPAPAQTVSNSTLNGAYWISTLEFPNGGTTSIRDANFKLTANGSGSFAEAAITGQAANIGNNLLTQATGALTYAITSDGSGTMSFPLGSGLDANTQIVSGVKNIYVSGDGSYFIGGSTAAGGHGIVLGVKAPAAATNATWTGFFFTAGLRYDTANGGRLAAVAGSTNALGDGNSVWARRTRQSDGLFDASPLITYNLTADGSGAFTSTSGRVTVGSNGQIFATSGVAAASSLSYEIYFGAKMPAQSGTGVFLNPQGVLNAANFAPPGYPVSPGQFVALYGTGLGTQAASAASLPFPKTLGGVQVTVNGIAAPIYSVAVSPVAQISAIVPYGVTGSTATIVVTVNNTKSNTVEVPLAPSAPGVFTVPSRGIGDAAIRHLDGTTVNANSPALRGEFVSVYLSGLGAVTPTVDDGAAAPSKEPLARVAGPVNIYIGGQLVSNIQYAGLTPTLAGLYQLNIQIPLTLSSGIQDLAVQTVDGFTDMANIAIN